MNDVTVFSSSVYYSSTEEFGPAVTEFVQAMNDGVEEAQRNILPKQGRKVLSLAFRFGCDLFLTDLCISVPVELHSIMY